LALDAEDNPHVVFENSTDPATGKLKYAAFDGAQWNVQDVREATSRGSLALNSAGNPHICYVDRTDRAVKYAAQDGSPFSHVGLDSTLPVRGISLAMDDHDEPHVAYSVGVGDFQHLKYASHSGTTFELQTLVDRMHGTPSLALDDAGYARIAYNAGPLALASFDGNDWEFEIVDAASDLVTTPSLALDGQGDARIAYFVRTDGTLKYAAEVGSTWEIEIVDHVASAVGISLALDRSGRPHISYTPPPTGGAESDLKYAWFSGAEWHVEVVDEAGAWNSSLALDTTDRPHIAYIDTIDGSLRYARAVPEPSGLGTLTMGVLAVAAWARRRRTRRRCRSRVEGSK